MFGFKRDNTTFVEVTVLCRNKDQQVTTTIKYSGPALLTTGENAIEYIYYLIGKELCDEELESDFTEEKDWEKPLGQFNGPY